jgi:hypothetical protein
VISRISPSTAVVERPLLLLLPVVVFLIPSLLFGFGRRPTYTAESRLLVAGFDVQAAAIPGFVEASRVLAQTYAGLINTPVIVDPAATKLKVAPGVVTGHISGSPVPDAAIIRVDGQASSPAEAVKFSRAAADALTAYSNQVSGKTVAQLLADYHAAAVMLAQDQARRDAAQAAVARGAPGAQDALVTAQADVAAAQLSADRASALYTQGGSSGGLQLIGAPAGAYSDRKSKLELALAVAVVLGLVAGTALATIVVNRPRWGPPISEARSPV